MEDLQLLNDNVKFDELSRFQTNLYIPMHESLSGSYRSCTSIQ